MDHEAHRAAAAARPGYTITTYPDDLSDVAYAAGVDPAAKSSAVRRGLSWSPGVGVVLPPGSEEPRAEQLDRLTAGLDRPNEARDEREELARQLQQVEADRETAAGQLAVRRADLGEIEARAAAATPAPWHVELSDHGYPQRIATRGAVLVAETFTGPHHLPTDAVFIASAREDVPRLVAEVRALRTRVRMFRVRRVAWSTVIVLTAVNVAVAAFAAAELLGVIGR